MNDRIPCGNYEALISYLYDECEPAERERFAAHVRECASCTEELRALQDTRAHLGAWTPPSLPLGFQITRTEETPAAKVVRPAVWWRQPLPAWAQAAAAVVIFAGGMSVTALRGDGVPAGSVAAVRPGAAAARPAAATAVSRDELARLDARLRSIESAQAQRAAAPLTRTGSGAIDERKLLDRVTALVDGRVALSEARQTDERAALVTALARELTMHRQATERVGAMEEELLQQRQAISTIAGSPIVRAALQSGAR